MKLKEFVENINCPIRLLNQDDELIWKGYSKEIPMSFANNSTFRLMGMHSETMTLKITHYNNNTLRGSIINYLQVNDMTQGELGEMVGCTASTICKYTKPGYDVYDAPVGFIYRLAMVFCVPVEELLKEEKSITRRIRRKYEAKED